MGMSTRSKTGASISPTSPIAKGRRAAESSRQPKGKKGSKVPEPRAKPGVGGAVGNTFPDSISLLNEAGTFVKTGDLFTDKTPGVVLFTYPRANTPGCTAQACSLRDAFPDLSKKGYTVVGLSYDKPKSQASWNAKHNLGYTLLCDTTDAGLIKIIGAHKAPKGIKRSVFVIRKEEGGKLNIVLSKIGVSPKDTVPTVKEYVDKNPCISAEKSTDEKQVTKDPTPDQKNEANGN